MRTPSIICGVAKGLQATHPVLLSQAPVSWSEPENIYFLSHGMVFYI